MMDPARQLAEIAKIIVDTSAMLSTRGAELLSMLIDQLPPNEEPSPLTVDASDDTTDETGMTVMLVWDNSGTGNSVTIDWGVTDVNDDEEPATGTATYRYVDAGTFTIMVTDLKDETRTASVDVTVPFGGRELTVQAVENTADATRMSVDVTADNSGSGGVTLNFGDAVTDTNLGDGTTVTTHQYATAGTYSVTATDDDDETRTATASVTIPFVATTAARRRRR